jgi:hypothetical protein
MRQVTEKMQFDLLFRWFVGVGIENPVWVPWVLTKNFVRLLTTDMLHKMMAAIIAHSKVALLLSEDRLWVDGPLVTAAPLKRLQPKAPDDQGLGDPPVPRRSNAIHALKTDPEPCLYKRSPGAGAAPCYMGHALMENRAGRIVQGNLSQAVWRAERCAAPDVVHRHPPGINQTACGADKGFGGAAIVGGVRRACVTPHRLASGRRSP